MIKKALWVLLAPALCYSLSFQSGTVELGLSVPVIPFLDGSRLVFQDFRSGAYKLLCHDFGTITTTELRNNATAYLHPLSVGGGRCAWIEYQMGYGGGGGIPIGGGGTGGLTGAYDVKLLTISPKSEQVISGSTAYKEHIGAGSKGVAWTDYRHMTVGDTFSEVYYHRFGVTTELRITSRASVYKANPATDEDRIVWQDYRNAVTNPKNGDIYLYDLTSSKETAICTAPGYQSQPHINRNIVVWQDYRNAGTGNNADIYSYDLASNSESPVCMASGYQAFPRVSGQYVVWQDYRNATTDTANADIYLFDLSARKEYAVTTRPGYQESPDISGNRITWFDYTDNKVYSAVIDPTGSIRVTSHSRAAYPGSTGMARSVDAFGRRIAGEKAGVIISTELELHRKVGP